MKKLLAFAVVLLLATTTTFAQGGMMNASPEERAQRQTERITERLKLDKIQSDKVYALNLDRAKQMQELFASGERDRTKMQDLQAKFDEKLKPLLTADQWSEYEKYRQEQQDRMRNRQR
jgi:hypothetical protein